MNLNKLRRLRIEAKGLYRSARENGIFAPIKFQIARTRQDYLLAFKEENPLVSVCIPTYNRADLLTTRCIPSLLAQTYKNLQIVVIGDGCTDDTVERMSSFNDARIVFRNLNKRGDYPSDSHSRYLIAGAVPTEFAYSLASGHWITRLDDDDSHSPERIAKLVEFAKRKRADLIYHPFDHQFSDGWRRNEARGFQEGQITTGSLFFHRYFMRVPYRPESIIKYQEPGDWNFCRQVRYLGARIRRHPDCMLTHYIEKNQAKA